MIDVTIIIVNYNTYELLKDCLNSILKNSEGIKYEIIVSDNGSSDNSVEKLRQEYPSVIVLDNKQNLGFGKANNRALEISNGKYIFYLNSDTLLCNNAIKYFYDYMESHKNENIGALGANLMDIDKRVIHSYGRFPSFLFLSKIIIRDIISQSIKLLLHLVHLEKEHLIKISQKKESYFGNVDYITGADLFVRNDINAKFDERFFLYYEETDLQKQMELKGLNRIIIDGPQIIHLEGGSNKTGIRRFSSFGNLTSYISMVYYCKKNISFFGSFILKILITFLWLNPMHFKYTKKFFKHLFLV